MRRLGPVLIAVGALLMVVGAAGHVGVVWAVGVALAAAGLAALLARRSRLAGLALAVALIAGLVVYPWLADRSAAAGQARWSVHAGQPGNFGLTAAGGRVLELDGSEARLLDARTGRRLSQVSVSETLVAQALDGSFFVVDNDTLTAFDREGRRRWHRAYAATPFAAAGGTALLSGCAGGSCFIRAIDAQGGVRWSRRADTGRSPLLLPQYSARPAVAPELLPDLALVSRPGGGDANTALDPRDGHVLVRAHKGSNDTVAPGRVLLQTQRSDRGCGLEIVARTGRTSSAPTGCGRVVGLATRAYVRSGSGGLDSVDLRTGRVHHLGEVESSTVAGDRVLVRRSGDRLTAVDPGSGRKLWSRGVPGERPPQVSIAGGVVSVIAEPHGLNPFLDGDARSNGDELIVLDARTGEEKGSLVAAAGIRGTVALGDGRVLAVDRDGVHRVVG